MGPPSGKLSRGKEAGGGRDRRGLQSGRFQSFCENISFKAKLLFVSDVWDFIRKMLVLNKNLQILEIINQKSS